LSLPFWAVEGYNFRRVPIPHFPNHLLPILIDGLPDIANMLLAVLGVMMSFPDKASRMEKNSILRKSIATSCFVLAAAALFVGAYQRQRVSAQMSTLVNNGNTLVINTNNTVTMTGVMISKLGTLTSLMADLDRRAAANKGNPKELASLRAQIAAAQDQTTKVSKQLLLSMAAGIANDVDNLAETQRVDEDRISHIFIGNNQMGFMKLGWAQRNQPSMATADYLRQQLLEELPPPVRTSEDSDEAKTFTFASTGGLVTADDLKKAARYLRELASRVAAQTEN
jgi:hypothetical protein